MQEIKKRRIVLASILKPANDIRMFGKIGLSLAAPGGHEVHLIGRASPAVKVLPNIHFHLLGRFNRISAGRVVARLKVFHFCIKVKPELLIVTTHELLIVAIAIRILFGTKIIYDVQENYGKNIRFTSAFPTLLRAPLASFVRLKEWFFAPFITTFFLAEKCYARELGFVGKNYLILENKCRIPEGFKRKPDGNALHLVFTGTIAESTGIFQAIELAKKLHEKDPRVHLTIAGYCSLPQILRKVMDKIAGYAFVSITGGDEMVPHSLIMDTIASANFGIISYPIAPHIENRIPTKLFEYLACELPVLLQDHPLWTTLAATVKGAIAINFSHYNADSLLTEMRQRNFYPIKPEGMEWGSEEEKLLGHVRVLLP